MIGVVGVVGWGVLNSLDMISGCADCYTEHEPVHAEDLKPAHPPASAHPAGATHGGRPTE